MFNRDHKVKKQHFFYLENTDQVFLFIFCLLNIEQCCSKLQFQSNYAGSFCSNNKHTSSSWILILRVRTTGRDKDWVNTKQTKEGNWGHWLPGTASQVKVVGIIAAVPAPTHSFQAWWILCHLSAFSSWGWLKQLPNRLTGIFGSLEETLSGRLIGYRRIANLCYLTAKPSWQNQVMSCNLSRSTHKGLHVTLPLVQREVINLISLKLQCSSTLKDSSRSSNCQYEIYQSKLWGNGKKWLPTHPRLSKNRLLLSGHVHTNTSIWAVWCVSASFRPY